MKWKLIILGVLLTQNTVNAQFMELDHLYKNDEPGISVAIIQAGRPDFKRYYGLADLTTKEKICRATRFNIASLTKQFTALAILQLEERKLLSLHDKISRFFPELDKQLAASISIQQLLTHSSGVPDHYAYTDTVNLKHAHNIDALTAIGKQSNTNFKPGTQFRYSNTAYCLLALIIERTSGLSFAGYMSKYIFDPAGMKNTGIWNENENIPHTAMGYDLDSATHQFKKSGAAENIFFSTEGDGGIYTTADDYVLWLQALTADKIFSSSITGKVKQLQFVINNEKKIGYGFGWFVDESKRPVKLYHSGSNGGFRTYSFFLPEENYMVVIFSNRSDINIEELVEKINKDRKPELNQFIFVQAMTS